MTVTAASPTGAPAPPVVDHVRGARPEQRTAPAAGDARGTQPGQSPVKGPWRRLALREIRKVHDMLPAQPGAPAAKRAEEYLDEARGIVGEKGSLRTWWTGEQIDLAYRAIHSAEAEAVALQPAADRLQMVEAIRHDAAGILDPGDPVLQSGGQRNDTATPAHARALVQRYRGAWDDRYVRSRSFRNRLLAMCAVAALFIAVVVAIGGAGLFSIQPTAAPGQPLLEIAWPTWQPGAGKLVVMVAIGIFGAIGGLLAGTRQVVQVGGVYNPYYLPMVSLLLKVLMGALCALAGVLAVISGIAPELHASTWGDVAAWALVFGAAQQLVTQLVDRRVSALVSSRPRETVVKK